MLYDVMTHGEKGYVHLLRRFVEGVRLKMLSMMVVIGTIWQSFKSHRNQ